MMTFFSFVFIGLSLLEGYVGSIPTSYLNIFLSAFFGWVGGFDALEIEAILRQNRKEINR